MRIGIIGGSFDPVHKGHIEMAQYVLKQKYVDEVWFLVAYHRPNKVHHASFYHRYQMVKYTIKPYRKMKVLDLEKHLPTPSYSYQTIQYLKMKYPSYQWAWLLGNDQNEQLQYWKNIEYLSKYVHFYIFPRDNLVSNTQYKHTICTTNICDVSSTEIRNGFHLCSLLKATKHYLRKHPIYLETMVSYRLSSYRFQHSLRVAKLCKELAKIHHYDEEKAYLAGLLHDLMKETKHSKMEIYMKHLFPQYMHLPVALWHAYVGSYYCSKLNFYDHSIRTSIYHHVLGEGKSKLSKLLYISDKLEPSRTYDTEDALFISKKNLKQGIECIKQQLQRMK